MDRAAVSERNRDKVYLLHPTVQLKVGEFLSTCEIQLGVVMLVTDGFRPFTEQAKLYAQGRTTPGKKVTWVKPGGSFHQFALAADIYPLLEDTPGHFTVDFDEDSVEGKTWYDFAAEKFPLTRPIAQQIGFELIGDAHAPMIDLKDPGHIQWTGGWTCAELLAAGFGHRPLSQITLPKEVIK